MRTLDSLNRLVHVAVDGLVAVVDHTLGVGWDHLNKNRHVPLVGRVLWHWGQNCDRDGIEEQVFDRLF